MTLPATSKELEQLVPHRPPMQWIESLIECTETEAKARAVFAKDHFAVVNGEVAESALVECVAQTVAAALGYRSRGKGSPASANLGMLAAVSNFNIKTRPRADAVLEIAVTEIKRLGPMLMVSGRISCEGQMIATGELSLYA